MRSHLLEQMIGTRDLGLIPESEMAREGKQAGGRLAVLQGPDATAFLRRLHETAVLAGNPSIRDISTLTRLVSDKEPAIRYWAVVGLGNLGAAARPVADRPESRGMGETAGGDRPG
jgi:hypothetical protein